MKVKYGSVWVELSLAEVSSLLKLSGSLTLQTMQKMGLTEDQGKLIQAMYDVLDGIIEEIHLEE